MSNLDYAYKIVYNVLSGDIDMWDTLIERTEPTLIFLKEEISILENLVTDATNLRNKALISFHILKRQTNGKNMKAEYYDIIVHALNDDIKQWEDLLNHYGESSVSKSEEKKKLREIAESNMISRKRALDYFKQEVIRED